MEPNFEIESRVFFTVVAWMAAVPAIGFVVYLLWRKFGPTRRHRRHGSRLKRYLGR